MSDEIKPRILRYKKGTNKVRYNTKTQKDSRGRQLVIMVFRYREGPYAKTKRILMSTGIKIYRNYWDGSRVGAGHPNAAKINKKLDTISEKCVALFLEVKVVEPISFRKRLKEICGVKVRKYKKPDFVLYRHYHGTELLYVGQSIHPVKRMRQHQRDSTWYRRITSITLTRYPSAEALTKAEVEAIRTEKPTQNKSKYREFDKRGRTG